MGIVVVALLVLPLPWWDPQARIVATLSTGITVDIPVSSQYGLADLEELTSDLLDVRSIRIQYGRSRSVQRVYPDSVVITLTAPWLMEKLRSPLMQLVDKGLQSTLLTPSPDSHPVIANVTAWVSFHDDICTTDLLITFFNNSAHPVDKVKLHLPARNWSVRSQEGESLDHRLESYELQVYLPHDLAPDESFVLLLSLDSKVIPMESYSLAEVVIVQPRGVTVEVMVKDHSGIIAHEFYDTEFGYWQVTFKSGGEN